MIKKNLEFHDVIKLDNGSVSIKNPKTNRWSRLAPQPTKNGREMAILWKELLQEQSGSGTDLVTNIDLGNIPVPEPQYQPWYHYHQSNVQDFGDYVCMKKSVLQDVGTFLGKMISK